MSDEYTSKGVGNAGLALGIIGTALGVMNQTGWSLFGGRSATGTGTTGYCQSFEGKVAELQSQVAAYQAEKYSDGVALEVYKAGVANYNKLNEKIDSNLEKLYGFVIDLDKRTALNEQGLKYENIITNNKIDAGTAMMEMQMANNKQLAELADASIISYVNSNFLPGTLKLPITSICPQPATNN